MQKTEKKKKKGKKERKKRRKGKERIWVLFWEKGNGHEGSCGM